MINEWLPALRIYDGIGEQRAHGLQLLVTITNIMEIKLETNPVHLCLAILARVEFVELPYNLFPVGVIQELVLEHRPPHGESVPHPDTVHICSDKRSYHSEMQICKGMRSVWNQLKNVWLYLSGQECF